MEYEVLLSLEDVKTNEFSSGVVDSEENVSRVLFLPNHFKDDKLHPSAFEQILQSCGLSVLRRDDNFESSLKKTIEIVEGKSNKKYKGYATASVKEIRGIYAQSYRLFYVLDTAKKDRLSHADVYTTRKSITDFPKELLLDLITSKIFKVFKQVYIIK